MVYHRSIGVYTYTYIYVHPSVYPLAISIVPFWGRALSKVNFTNSVEVQKSRALKPHKVFPLYAIFVSKMCHITACLSITNEERLTPICDYTYRANPLTYQRYLDLQCVRCWVSLCSVKAQR